MSKHVWSKTIEALIREWYSAQPMKYSLRFVFRNFFNGVQKEVESEGTRGRGPQGQNRKAESRGTGKE